MTISPLVAEVQLPARTRSRFISKNPDQGSRSQDPHLPQADLAKTWLFVVIPKTTSLQSTARGDVLPRPSIPPRGRGAH